MKKRRVLIWFLSILFIAGVCQPARAEDPEKEARAVFVKLVQAAKANNETEFKSFIVPRDLQEMEKEGFVELMMNLVAGENPDAFTAEVKEDQIVFSRQINVDTPEEKSSGKTSVTMVKEAGQWKFGKPPK